MIDLMIILFPKYRQILLHWGYELVKNDFCYNVFVSKIFFSSLTILLSKLFFLFIYKYVILR